MHCSFYQWMVGNVFLTNSSWPNSQKLTNGLAVKNTHFNHSAFLKRLIHKSAAHMGTETEPWIIPLNRIYAIRPLAFRYSSMCGCSCYFERSRGIALGRVKTHCFPSTGRMSRDPQINKRAPVTTEIATRWPVAGLDLITAAQHHGGRAVHCSLAGSDEASYKTEEH